MTLIVEDGTGRADAESLTSVAFADAYHASLGNAGWAALSTPVKEQNLRKGTRYMQGEYAGRWSGTKVRGVQALDHPRSNMPLRDGPGQLVGVVEFWPFDTVALAVQQACADLALMANDGELAPVLTRGILSETVGPISTTYDPSSSRVPLYRAVDMALKPFMKNGGGASSVSLLRG